MVKTFEQFFVLLIFILGSTLSTSAQNREATLVVTGSGAIKEEATSNALRSAVAQAYGVFVSANTQVLNEELVKDEIVTVTAGSIKGYREIADIDLPDGRKEVTLQATVSIAQLVSYAQAKGFSCELAGSTFAENMKLKRLNKVNEERIIASALKTAKELYSCGYDYRIQVGEPTFNLAAAIKAEEARGDGDIKTSSRLYRPFLWNVRNESDNQYGVVATITSIPNSNALNAYNMLINTFQSVSLNKQEKEEYDKLGYPYYSIVFCHSKGESDGLSVDFRHYFRSKRSVDELNKFFNLDFPASMWNFGIETEAGVSVMKVVSSLAGVGPYSRTEQPKMRRGDSEPGRDIYSIPIPDVFYSASSYFGSYERIFYSNDDKLKFIKWLLCSENYCYLTFPYYAIGIKAEKDYAFIADFEKTSNTQNKFKVLLGIPKDVIGRISTIQVKSIPYEENQ